ncbi:L,D-transpeptidase family protein [Desulfallas sp. Bu1-1]|jgi:LysM repeat protein|uniref:L,D-transpeptidase family protein n=1 Tax=Desulfallas sp. Bu1-1 TaxID=2787620 RepID=UPI00189F39A0|nr:L,D-transpeptidase family protein [Desulfallas sp. Bu1-1]MBF7082673.1 L,D-transpeptidase family protein [Desulfallas sp. Bu1-1]
MAAEKFDHTGQRLTINTVQRRLRHFNGERLMKEYPVAVGKPSTPTPPGSYKIKNKIVNPGGILGTRWMGLTIPGGNYGIHGTNNPASIGNAVSLGCIRMHNHDIEELFPQVAIGTPVEIFGGSGADPVTGVYQSSLPAGDGNKTYTVQPGDTLWNIARKFNTTLNALTAVNNLANPDRIYPGQVIIIPRPQTEGENF